MSERGARQAYWPDVSDGHVGLTLSNEIFTSFCNDFDFAPLVTYDTEK